MSEVDVAMKLAERKDGVGWTAFGIVIEAKMSVMVKMAEERDYRKEDFVEFAAKMWDKYCLSNEGRKKGVC